MATRIPGRGMLIPGVDEGLIDIWRQNGSTAGTYVTAESIEAAQTITENAIAEGVTVSDEYPLLFSIYKNFYFATGAKKNGKIWLDKADQAEFYPDTRTNSVTLSLPLDRYSPLIASALPMAPYDREVTACGGVYGKVITGTAAMRIQIGTVESGIKRYIESKFGDNVEGGDSKTITIKARIPAWETPDITVGYIGTRTGVTSEVKTSVDKDFNYLDVSATPVSMA